MQAVCARNARSAGASASLAGGSGGSVSVVRRRQAVSLRRSAWLCFRRSARLCLQGVKRTWQQGYESGIAQAGSCSSCSRISTASTIWLGGGKAS